MLISVPKLNRNCGSLLIVFIFSMHLFGQTNGPRELSGGGQGSTSSFDAGLGQPRPPMQLAPQPQLDRILNFWEQRSAAVKTYQCTFTRFEYDPVFGPKGHAKTTSRGIIKYAAPDKGMFRVQTVGHFTPPAQPGDAPAWPQKKADYAEHWICDGESIFEFNAKEKLLIETRLPPELRGKAITDGPLPFLFGATADALKKRYWIQQLQAPQEVSQYWLRAYPKSRRDASNFQCVEVRLDRELFLPVAMKIYPPNFDPNRNPVSTSYSFEDRKVNNLVDQLQEFMNSFVRPRVPVGWRQVVEHYEQPGFETEVPLIAPARGQNNQARSPAGRNRR